MLLRAPKGNRVRSTSQTLRGSIFDNWREHEGRLRKCRRPQTSIQAAKTKTTTKPILLRQRLRPTLKFRHDKSEDKRKENKP